MKFNEFGLLEPKDFKLTISELKNSILVQGNNIEFWDTNWRMQLVDNLEIMANQLWEVGIEKIFIDGSFVEEKAHPNDIDGYFECDVTLLEDIVRNLNLIDSDKIWTWDHRSRIPYKQYHKLQLPMWHKYRVELFPHFGQSSGIVDEFGNEQQFPATFRKTRDTFEPKGIVEILKK